VSSHSLLDNTLFIYDGRGTKHGSFRRRFSNHSLDFAQSHSFCPRSFASALLEARDLPLHAILIERHSDLALEDVDGFEATVQAIILFSYLISIPFPQLHTTLGFLHKVLTHSLFLPQHHQGYETRTRNPRCPPPGQQYLRAHT
jgi:hypothetical protein